MQDIKPSNIWLASQLINPDTKMQYPIIQGLWFESILETPTNSTLNTENLFLSFIVLPNLKEKNLLARECAS